MGIGPTDVKLDELNTSDKIAGKVKEWLRSGFNKEEKAKLLSSIPRKGKLDLEAPSLNEEIAADLHPKAQAKDDHFKDYQNLAGAALSSALSALSAILHDGDTPLVRDKLLNDLSNAVKLTADLFYNLNQARKLFLVGRFEEKIQKILKKLESTSWLFGDNLRAVIDNAKALEKVYKEMKPKPKAPLKPTTQQRQALNWESSSSKRKRAQGSAKPYEHRPSTAGTSSSARPSRSQQGKRYYAQT